MPVVAPMPSVRQRIAARVKPGRDFHMRNPNLRSCQNVSTRPPRADDYKDRMRIAALGLPPVTPGLRYERPEIARRTGAVDDGSVRPWDGCVRKRTLF